MDLQTESKVLHLKDSIPDDAKQYLEEAGTQIKLNQFTGDDLKNKQTSKNSKYGFEISWITSEVLNDYMDMDKNGCLSLTYKVRSDTSSSSRLG